jgi:phosphatidylserine/phosphatidylglycerophosphate/cardiolipin synthase-like enzyme
VNLLRSAGGDRVAVYGIENHLGSPIYVHAKVCIVDDRWAIIGSDNVNLRSWTYDSELSCAVLNDDRSLARDLRLTLAREHLERADGDDADLTDPVTTFDAFLQSAKNLDAWHENGPAGQRPAGRLRPYDAEPLTWVTRMWARPLYRILYDPDGRPAQLRRRGEF